MQWRTVMGVTDEFSSMKIVSLLQDESHRSLFGGGDQYRLRRVSKYALSIVTVAAMVNMNVNVYRHSTYIGRSEREESV